MPREGLGCSKVGLRGRSRRKAFQCICDAGQKSRAVHDAIQGTVLLRRFAF
jgi:hypothetical protein